MKFNAYAKFMTTFPLIKAVSSYLLYFSILFHAFDGLLLAFQNRKARPIRYAYEKAGANNTWYSRRMALLGTLVLVFLVIHMRGFWYEMHWGAIGVDADGNKDLFAVVEAAFGKAWYVGLYVVMMGVLAFHLMHGFQSAFQSLGPQPPTLHAHGQERGRVLRRGGARALRPDPRVDVLLQRLTGR